MKTTKTKRTPKPKAKRTVKCRALELGHKSCRCGGPYCGARIHEP